MLNAKNLGLAGGILWGLSVFVMTWAAQWLGYGTLFLDMVASVYPGYEISAIGSVVGLAYGFFDGFIGLFLLAFIYNKLNS